MTSKTQIEAVKEKFLNVIVQLILQKNLINYSPKISLEEGIKEIIFNGPIQSEWATSERHYSIDK